MKTKQPEREGKRLSPCCKAELDYTGGGYDGDSLCDMQTHCLKCHQLLEVNGSSFGIEIINPKTGKQLK